MALPPLQSVGTALTVASSVGSLAAQHSAKFAGLLRDRLAASSGSLGSGYQLPNGGGIDVAQLRASANRDLASLQKKLQPILAANNLASGAAVTLQSTASGQVQVAGPEGQQSQIASVLASHPDVQMLVTSIGQKWRMMAAASNASGTPGAAAASPNATVSVVVGAQQLTVSYSPAV